jgi:hypothetical protein
MQQCFAQWRQLTALPSHVRIYALPSSDWPKKNPRVVARRGFG